MPAVGDLDRLRRGLPGAVGVGAGAVPADDLGSRVLPQPGGEGGRLPVGQQVHRLVGGHVDQHGAVGVAAAQREVVHPQHPDPGRLGLGQGAQQPQQGGAAGPGPKGLRQPGAAAARQRQADRLQHRLQQRAAPGVPGGQPRDLLGERARPAAMIVAEEPADPQPEHDPAPADRRIRQPALVAAVYPGRPMPAAGAGRLGRLRAGPDPHTGVGVVDLLDVTAARCGRSVSRPWCSHARQDQGSRYRLGVNDGRNLVLAHIT
jgi:hypothetical protein